MSFTPFARYRNFTLANLKSLLEVYPDMAGSISWDFAKDLAEERLKGYKRTAYQQACQLGLEDRSTNSFKVHNYLYTFDDNNLTRYLVFWFKTYYAPNPYVKSDDEAFILYCRLCEDILQSENHSVSFEEFVEKNIGGKSDDILLTVANRFVKFALKKFNLICRELCSSLDAAKGKNAGQNMYTECYREALEIQRITDDILRDRFFDDVRKLTIMPQNNQVLEKREGYRQIFYAAAMVDLALQLNWEGEQVAYSGESKNTALLYEYWLFFELRKIISSIENCQCIQASEKPFINTDNGLTISLSEGQTSCQAFLLPDLGTRVNLYYNRTFSREEFSNTKYAGSYSRPFRPDYTLEVYPSDYLKPEDAIREGAVSYIHFDAKYRITDLRSFIGPDENEMTEEQIKEEVENDKHDSVTNTYKRGDLLKMHTYNDAIRRTVGSYVLYPGDFDSKIKNYRLFEEVLPGVGAFAIKPSIQTDSENVLKDFIYEIIEARSRKYSRLNRMLSYSNLVLGEPVISTLDKRTTGKEKDNKNIHNDLCVIGYLRHA